MKPPVFLMVCGFGGSKSRPAKAAGAEPSSQMRNAKLHAVVARTTCGTQEYERKIDGPRPLLEVEMPKKCMLLWHEAHFQVKSV